MLLTANAPYLLLLVVSTGLMLAQLSVKQKTLAHIFYAIFCGSMAMVAAQQLSAESLGPYQYIIGFGACATCNATWLIARSLFSGEKAISARHIAFALLISLLIIVSQSLQMAFELSILTTSIYGMLKDALSEVIVLLSSTVLALTFWEALKGFKTKTLVQRWQRFIFLFSFCAGVFLCTIVAKAFVDPAHLEIVYPWLMVFSALQIMLSIQLILCWQKRKQIQTVTQSSTQFNALNPALENQSVGIDPALVAGINKLIIDDKKYLTHHLKMIDIANELGVSEYKISQAIRYHFASPNFNHFVNSFRVEHAKHIFAQPSAQEWTILVIALESGFSSITSFNRAFKAEFGYAPNQYRRTLQQQGLPECE